VFLLGVLVFVFAEIAAFVVVAERIGFVWALGILILVSALGPFVLRRVGVGVLAQTQTRLAQGEVPTRELLDGLVVLLGGAMICIPGFITDALGLLLMIAPVRHLVIRVAGHRVARRAQTLRVSSWRVPGAGSGPTPHDPSPPLGPPPIALGPGGRPDADDPATEESP
jgi:UPF0716 protein FxsA